MNVLAQTWWVLVLRGVLAVLFGVLAYVWPALTIASFVLLYGAYALVTGMFSLVAAFRAGRTAPRALLMLSGVLGVLAGCVVLAMPTLSAVFLFYVVAVWAVATGVAEVFHAIALRKVVAGEWRLALAGALSIGLGVFMFARPAAGLLGLAWAVSLYAIATGVTLMLLGLRLHRWAKTGRVDLGTPHAAIA